MSYLDINSTKGKISVKDEDVMLSFIKKSWNVDIIETKKSGKDASAAIDGCLVKNNIIVGIFESKCRYNKTYDKFISDYGSWLITHEKIEKGKLLSTHLNVPFFGFLHIVKSAIVLYWKITNNRGEYEFEFKVENSLTQKTINGGLIYRDNAYLDIKHSKFVNNKNIPI